MCAAAISVSFIDREMIDHPQSKSSGYALAVSDLMDGYVCGLN